MSKLTFWNTLTRTRETFRPIDPDNVRMYVCGPTVYDFAHIGNARPVIVFDVLYRLLRHVYGEDHVTYVRNITDVDDKINARALRDYPDLPLNQAIANVTEKTADRFHTDVAALGCLPPNHEPRATDHIAGMASMIQRLIDKDNAYVASGREGREVLFSVGSMPDYGKLSNRKLEDQQAGARIAVEDHKRNPADFVLWKESASDEPGWDGGFTENGKSINIHGRPGWHIECSVMSEHHLGKTFDIHGGGLDLIFPHHENEIAQSCCAHGTERMANLWMHNGFLQVEGKKMSKSDGNFVTIAELLETEKFGGRTWHGGVLRLAMLMTHYREPIDFSVKRLEEAHSIWKKFADWSMSIKSHFGNEIMFERGDPLVEFLADDLGVYRTLSALNDVGRAALAGDVLKAKQFVSTLALLGFENLDMESQRITDLSQHLTGLGQFDTALIDGLIMRRLALIAAKNWAEADKIRDELLAQGIQLKDGKDPETGERVTTWEVKR